MGKHKLLDVTDDEDELVKLINNNIEKIIPNYYVGYRYVLSSIVYNESISSTVKYLESMDTAGTKLITDGEYSKGIGKHGAKCIEFKENRVPSYSLITHTTVSQLFKDTLLVDIMFQGDVIKLKDAICNI